MCLQIPCVPIWVRQPQRAHTESPSLSKKNRAYKSLASFLGEAATARAKSSLQIVPCRFGRISHRTCLQIVRFLFRARNGKVSVFECLQTMYADTSFLPYLVSGPPYREGLGYIIDTDNKLHFQKKKKKKKSARFEGLSLSSTTTGTTLRCTARDQALSPSGKCVDCGRLESSKLDYNR